MFDCLSLQSISCSEGSLGTDEPLGETVCTLNTLKAELLQSMIQCNKNLLYKMGYMRSGF